MKDKRVLMIGLTSPLEGGSQRHIYEISSRMKNCTVLTQRGSICEEKIELPVIKKSIFLRNISFAFLCYLYMIKLLIFKKYDVIHIHENVLYPLSFLLKLRYKVVISVHGIEGFKYYNNKFYWFFFKSALSNADILIAVSKLDESLLKKHFKNVYHVPTGVDLSLYKKIKTKVENKITFIGRMHEQKGIIYLLESFDKIKDKIPGFKLELIGAVNDYGKDLQRKYNDKRIIWRGFMGDRKETFKHLKSSYCIVLPSLWEGFPATLLEAMASGRPVVLSDIPIFTSVAKKGAIFFKNKDSTDLGKKLIMLTKNSKYKNKINIEGIKLSEKYDWPNIVKQIEKVYISD